ncbi:hypothetical protein N7519_000553 [Penicillium mononematosum]|uniref:uncharacterized protein n=1 Tax=Penicillium mononematosum TaxID=268346 RepID=UPI0025482DC3|nr:uncharacterized protein N7519_000553 [Penicillium mononematosum]KAJ6190532.1 hypothetical protein N7519_000553 [Penicillium mononematosum]
MGLVEKLLVPDENILSEILPDVIDLKSTSYSIISNTFNTCTFRIQLETAPLLDYPKDLIVRLEKSGRSLAALATFQRLASSHLNDLIPSVLQVRTTTTAATEVDYFVTPYFTGTITLEDVWDTLDETNQLELVNNVILAVDKLQKLDLGQSLKGTPYISIDDNSPQPVKIAIGDLTHGFFPSAKEFLQGLLPSDNKKPPDWKLLELGDGITIQSAHEDIGQIDLSNSELDELQKHAVLCHNDLEPRNILVRKGSTKYELAGIIDWDMAGFFPFAYEYGYKDTVLGNSNLSFSWYTMFKNQSSYLLPRGECHTKLIKALRIIDHSTKRSREGKFSTVVQIRWLQREQVEESSDLRQGWVRKAGANPPKGFSKDDQTNLEEEVLKELGLI